MKMLSRLSGWRTRASASWKGSSAIRPKPSSAGQPAEETQRKEKGQPQRQRADQHDDGAAGGEHLQGRIAVFR